MGRSQDTFAEERRGRGREVVVSGKFPSCALRRWRGGGRSGSGGGGGRSGVRSGVSGNDAIGTID